MVFFFFFIWQKQNKILILYPDIIAGNRIKDIPDNTISNRDLILWTGYFCRKPDKVHPRYYYFNPEIDPLNRILLLKNRIKDWRILLFQPGNWSFEPDIAAEKPDKGQPRYYYFKPEIDPLNRTVYYIKRTDQILLF